MRRGVRRDSMYSFSKSVSLDRKENDKGGLPYWNEESALDWLEYYHDNKLKFKDFFFLHFCPAKMQAQQQYQQPQINKQQIVAIQQ